MNNDFNTMMEKMRNNRVPDYYDGMHKEGWQPWEILEAAHNSIIKQTDALQAERDAAQQPAPMNVHFQVEVKKK